MILRVKTRDNLIELDTEDPYYSSLIRDNGLAATIGAIADLSEEELKECEA